MGRWKRNQAFSKRICARHEQAEITLHSERGGEDLVGGVLVALRAEPVDGVLREGERHSEPGVDAVDLSKATARVILMVSSTLSSWMLETGRAAGWDSAFPYYEGPQCQPTLAFLLWWK